MADEKRMAGDYEITHSVHIGDKEIILGEDLDNKDGYFYMVADCIGSDLFLKYENCMISDDFTELAEIFAQRLTEQVQKVKAEHEQINVPTAFITSDKCTQINPSENIENKVIVIKPEVLRAECRLSVNQLYLATGGNGVQGNARGRAVFCTNLYDKEHTRFERYDVMGTMESDKLPDWAKKNLEELTSIKEKTKNQRERRDRFER